VKRIFRGLSLEIWHNDPDSHVVDNRKEAIKKPAADFTYLNRGMLQESKITDRNHARAFNI